MSQIPLCVSPWCRTDRDTCELRPRLAAHGLTLCWTCRDRIVDDAKTATELHEALAYTLAGGYRTRRELPRSRGATGLALDPIVMEARDAIRVTLAVWCRIIAQQRALASPRDEVPAMALYVVRHADWLAAHPRAGEVAKDLRDVATDPRSWRLAYPTSRDGLYIGDCPHLVRNDDGQPQACGTRLYQQPDEPEVTCRGCGTSDTIEQWQRWIVGDTCGLVDAYAAAAHLAITWRRPVDPAVIRQWAHRGHITRRRKDERGRTLYHLPELAEHARHLWNGKRGSGSTAHTA